MGTRRPPRANSNRQRKSASFDAERDEQARAALRERLTTRRRIPLRCRVYVIEAVGTGLVKIGRTDRCSQDRLKELQATSPHKLRVLFTMRGDDTTERELHERFAEHRVRGQWFERRGALDEWVTDAAAAYEELIAEINRDLDPLVVEMLREYRDR